MKRGEVVIHFLDPEALSEALAFEILSDEERLRAERFRSKADAQRWGSFRAQVRTILGQTLGLNPLDVPILLSEQGKPLLAPPHAGLHFNLSHCSDLGVIGLCLDGPIGVDIEPLDRNASLQECELIFCHPEEIASLPGDGPLRAKRLLEIWTAKEAILKALGTGLMHPPERIYLDLSSPVGMAKSDIFVNNISDLRIYTIQDRLLANHHAVIAVPRTVRSFRILG